MKVRNFPEFLREQRGGETSDEMGDALTELVAAVTETGKKGTLTLTITVAPMKESRGGQLVVYDDIKLKKPMLPRGATVFFATPENHLQRNDPRQPDLPGIREVPAASADNAQAVTVGEAKHGTTD